MSEKREGGNLTVSQNELWLRRFVCKTMRTLDCSLRLSQDTSYCFFMLPMSPLNALEEPTALPCLFFVDYARTLALQCCHLSLRKQLQVFFSGHRQM